MENSLSDNARKARWQTALLCSTLLVYAAGRILQLYPERFPILLLVVLQVAPTALFALLHGWIHYGLRGLLAFCTCCLGVAGLSESLSLRTGFPFGHYYFTQFMGPGIAQVPALLVLAYLGIGYCSWVLSVVTLGYQDQRLILTRIVKASLLASFTMTAWDLSMEAIWATLDRAWIWRDGGLFFGVPLSNFFGWYLTTFLVYAVFATYCRSYPTQSIPPARGYWGLAVVCYALCAFGNLFIFRKGLFPDVVTDAAGKQWATMNILIAGALVSILGMGSMAVLAWLRLRAHESATK